ncbi:2272_t:CDS:2 [Diversispora eburnea]|uniref:2272_t:CDS:1 n=1 Tax=Diversispora eburnea TaxID=1213867 RepID=A0A9N8ZNY2_9GLOM|nr:2272_t:CDS:2 [Diversispora eburnea]
MEQNNKSPYQDQTQIRLSQHANLAKFFMDTMAEYRNLQMENVKKYRERIISQYQIVKSDATEEEINELLGEKSGEFLILRLFSTTSDQKRLIVSEIQDRHRDVHRIEKSINELNKMFSEVQALVIEQAINIPLAKGANIIDEELGKNEIKPDYLSKKSNESFSRLKTPYNNYT